MADFTTFKRGDSFNCTDLVWTPSAGEPADLEGWTVESSILDADRKRHELTVTNPSGDYINYVAFLLDTSEWAVGDAYWDVKYYHTSGIVRTETWTFTVTPQVTL